MVTVKEKVSLTESGHLSTLVSHFLLYVTVTVELQVDAFTAPPYQQQPYLCNVTYLKTPDHPDDVTCLRKVRVHLLT